MAMLNNQMVNFKVEPEAINDSLQVQLVETLKSGSSNWPPAIFQSLSTWHPGF